MAVPKSLLLIDESQWYCALMTQELRRVVPGIGVWTMSGGQQAIEHLALCGSKHGMVDLVLLDRKMREGPDGCAVLRAVRALAHLETLAMVMVCGSSEREHMDEAHAAGASGYIVKPPDQADYPRLVGEVLDWWTVREEEKMLRSFCAALTTGESHREVAPLQSSRPLMETVPAFNVPVFSPTAPGNPLAEVARHLGDFFGYLSAGKLPNTSGLFTDRKLMEMTIACREVGIEERHARGKSQDPVLVEKRGRVIKRLMALEWSNTELLERFGVRRRTMVNLRRDFVEETRKSCALVARGRH